MPLKDSIAVAWISWGRIFVAVVKFCTSVDDGRWALVLPPITVLSSDSGVEVYHMYEYAKQYLWNTPSLETTAYVAGGISPVVIFAVFALLVILC